MKRHLLGIIISVFVFCLAAETGSRASRIYHHSCYTLVLPVVKAVAEGLAEDDTAVKFLIPLIRLMLKY